jgi:hypothetical protein
MMQENILQNKVYAAIGNHLSELEGDGKYSGNSHHLNQRLTQMVSDALMPVVNALQAENERYKKQVAEDAPLVTELSSLKTTLYQSNLKHYFPEREMSFHDKVLFSIAEMSSENERMREALTSLLNANPRGVDKAITDEAKQALAQTPGQVGGSEKEKA